MHAVFKIFIGLAAALLLLAGFIMAWPMTASRLIYPMVEAYAIDDFVGITANGQVKPDLFAIEATSIPTEPVVIAANRFLETLTPEQRSRATFPVDDKEWQQG